MREGESLSMIAQRELGSMDRWAELARLNNIADPKKLKPGTRLRIPGPDASVSVPMPPTPIAATAVRSEPTPPPVSPEPRMTGPHVRMRAGSTRFRAGASAPWQNLADPMPIASGAQVMTANNGWADMRAGDAFFEIGPFSIVKVGDLMPQGGAMIRLQLGSVVAHSAGSPVLIDADAAKVNVTNAEARIVVDESGAMKVTPTSGVVKLITPDGKTTALEPGKWAWLKAGMPMTIKEQMTAVMLVSPVGNKVVTEKDVLFEWTPMPGAKGYRFSLTPDDPRMPKLEDQQTVNPKILVTSVPEGKYTWRVTPLGMADAAPSIPGKFSVARNAPSLELSPPMWGEGSWWLKGRTAPGAYVTVGDKDIRANERGEFSIGLGSGEGILMLGVEARMAPGGAVTRKAMTVASRPSGATVPVVVNVPSGKMMLNDEAAPAEARLAEGRNAFFWQWMVDDAEAAHGRFELTVDMTAPTITAVKAAQDKVMSGDDASFRIAANDKGSGLADASTASITVEGPNNWKQSVKASELTASGEYVFRFKTPRNLPSGILKITAIEISDNDGNAIVLDGEGMTTDVEDPDAKFREFFRNILLIGVGVAAGAAI